MTSPTITIPSTAIPVHSEVDVLVAGGGPAGFAAAVSAARAGARTLLVERFGVLGGMWTAALVNPYFDVTGKGGLNDELRGRLLERKAWGGLRNITYDPAEMTLQLDDLVTESGAQVLLYALATRPLVENNQVKGAVVETKSGPLAILAKVTIDCTGDADLAARAGAPFQQGRPADGLMQPMTMMFRISGLRADYPEHHTTLWYRALREIVGEENLLKGVPFKNPALVRLPQPGEAMIQWTHVRGVSGIDADELTRATLEGRQQVKRAMEFLRQAKHELGDIRLVALPVAIGVRETRRITGGYTLSLEDLKAGRRFDDGICLVRFPIDIHEPGDTSQTVGYIMKPYHIPFRCLVPQNVENLLVAGRPISGTYEAHASYRVTGNCVAMGEAAGLAAALAVQRKVTPRQVPGKEVADMLRKRGVLLDGEGKNPESPKLFVDVDA
jgi:hypothetical protein